MTQTTVIFDTEFFSIEESYIREWQGAQDPMPAVAQIGALKVELKPGLPIVEEFVEHIIPVGRTGQEQSLTRNFQNVTGISQEAFDKVKRPLKDVIPEFAQFVGDDYMHSYGRDVDKTILPSCFASAVECPFPLWKNIDVKQFLVKTEVMTNEEANGCSSGRLAKHFGIDIPDHYEHDARQDAYSILVAYRHLLKEGYIPLQALERCSIPSTEPTNNDFMLDTYS